MTLVSTWELTRGQARCVAGRYASPGTPNPTASEAFTAPYAPSSIKGRILGELAKGHRRFRELTAVAHCSPGTAANALAVLKRRGRVRRHRGYGRWELVR